MGLKKSCFNVFPKRHCRIHLASPSCLEPVAQCHFDPPPHIPVDIARVRKGEARLLARSKAPRRRGASQELERVFLLARDSGELQHSGELERV